jgi:diguanylate cyclase (GGDEF)-like protein
MTLDLPSLMAMGAFVHACIGAVLLFAWWGNRKVASLAIWGLADLCASSGLFCLMFGAALHVPVMLAVGSCLLTFTQALVWKAARSFDDKRAPLGLVLLGPIIVGCLSAIPGMKGFNEPISLALSTCYIVALAISVWAGRKDRLPARWPIFGFAVVHATILSIGVYSTFFGDTTPDFMPALVSAFGLIHFEPVVFALGTAVFLLTLVKERSESASRVAAGLDSLTGIANRAAFMDAAAQVIERCRQEGAPVSVLMFDLDRFKTINDSHGHATGDAVIRKFCEVSAAALWPTDVFGRIGGEEFAVIMPGSNAGVAYLRAERIRASFAESCRIVGAYEVNATVSCGVAASLNSGLPLSELLEVSDRALYSAKASGRNRVKLADQVMSERDPSSVIRVA